MDFAVARSRYAGNARPERVLGWAGRKTAPTVFNGSATTMPATMPIAGRVSGLSRRKHQRTQHVERLLETGGPIKNIPVCGSEKASTDAVSSGPPAAEMLMLS
jgi:hypothetical protein